MRWTTGVIRGGCSMPDCTKHIHTRTQLPGDLHHVHARAHAQVLSRHYTSPHNRIAPPPSPPPPPQPHPTAQVSNHCHLCSHPHPHPHPFSVPTSSLVLTLDPVFRRLFTPSA